ncbi:hypothetical protein PAMA_021115 [Pampus argenteus]
MASSLYFIVVLCLTSGLWAGADFTCVDLGGNLASIRNADDYAILREVVNKATGEDKASWIGGYDAVKEGSWTWSDGSAFEFTGWAKGEPNNYLYAEHCMEMNFEAALSSCSQSCPVGWTQVGSRCYKFESAEKEWVEAELACIALGGNLASIRTAEDYAILREVVNKATGKDKASWIGGYDAVKVSDLPINKLYTFVMWSELCMPAAKLKTANRLQLKKEEGAWTWSDGSAFEFTSWAKGEPNNYLYAEHCMEMNFEGRDYVNDERCNEWRSFICAKDAE